MRRTLIMQGMLVMLTGLIFTGSVYAGAYLDSAHGNSTYGVKRTAAGFPADYATGFCAHCHEMHASFDGAEPAPDANSPSLYTLFYDNHIDQTDNFCFQCHTDVGSFQDGGGITNRSYSYRAGEWNADPVNDVLQQFSFLAAGNDSSHSLDDILKFISTNQAPMNTWEYTADSNPCSACHNSHSAQGDPPNSPGGFKISGSRGWPVSRPSQHDADDNNAWGLWGDVIGERMSDYTANYQAPLRFTAGYEPDGSGLQDGSNLTDYVTFCTDCHDNANMISSMALGRNLKTFDWNIEKHGVGAADDDVPNVNEPDTCSNIKNPYLPGSCGTYVLACTDCHEPHGSPNIFLTRMEVNGSTVTVDSGTGNGPSGDPNTEWINLCNNCHDIVIGDGRHDHPAAFPPVPPGPGCDGVICHGPLVNSYGVCTDCHNHGNEDIIDILGPNRGPYGDQLF